MSASSTAATAGAVQQQPFAASFHLTQHNHGKAKVRVMKVRHKQGGRHEVSEYTVDITLFNSRGKGARGDDKCFTDGDNSDLVATDTQKNTVYIVAKACPCESPAHHGSLIALQAPLVRSVPVLYLAPCVHLPCSSL